MMTYQPTEVEIEIRNRIRLLIASYSYEYLTTSYISDYEFDELAKKINPEVETGHKVCDEFFKTKFHPHTGCWIWDFPKEEKDKLKSLCKRLKITDHENS